MADDGVHFLKVAIPAEDFVPIAEAAHRNGQTPEQWVVEQIVRAAPSRARLREARERLLARIAELNIPDGDNAHNEAIDRDLADEYGSDHSDAA